MCQMAFVYIRNAKSCVIFEHSHQQISHFLVFGGLVKPIFRVFWGQNWHLDTFRGPVVFDIRKYRVFSSVLGVDIRKYRIFSSFRGLPLSATPLWGTAFWSHFEDFFAAKMHSKISIDFKMILDDHGAILGWFLDQIRINFGPLFPQPWPGGLRGAIE